MSSNTIDFQFHSTVQRMRKIMPNLRENMLDKEVGEHFQASSNLGYENPHPSQWLLPKKSKQTSGSKENLNKPEQPIARRFLQQKHPFLKGPSLRMTQQAAPIQPEGSPQARRATGWLFVTKCSRLNADITVISSPTKPEAKNRGKS